MSYLKTTNFLLGSCTFLGLLSVAGSANALSFSFGTDSISLFGESCNNTNESSFVTQCVQDDPNTVSFSGYYFDSVNDNYLVVSGEAVAQSVAVSTNGGLVDGGVIKLTNLDAGFYSSFLSLDSGFTGTGTNTGGTFGCRTGDPGCASTVPNLVDFTVGVQTNSYYLQGIYEYEGRITGPQTVDAPPPSAASSLTVQARTADGNSDFSVGLPGYNTSGVVDGFGPTGWAATDETNGALREFYDIDSLDSNSEFSASSGYEFYLLDYTASPYLANATLSIQNLDLGAGNTLELDNSSCASFLESEFGQHPTQNLPASTAPDGLILGDGQHSAGGCKDISSVPESSGSAALLTLGALLLSHTGIRKIKAS